MRKGDALYYLYGDHLGSTSLTTDVDGNVVYEARYHPFGEERWSSGVGVTDFGYTGQREESGFGLQDFNARYFSPKIGRFLTPDSIVPDFSNPQSLNRFAYTLNNPVKYRDPTGHYNECSVAGEGCGGYGSGEVVVGIEKGKQWREEILTPDLYIKGTSGRFEAKKFGVEQVYDFSTNEISYWFYAGFYVGTDSIGGDVSAYEGVGWKGDLRGERIREAYAGAFHTFGGGAQIPVSDWLSIGADVSVSGDEFEFFTPVRTDYIKTVTVGGGLGQALSPPIPIGGHYMLSDYGYLGGTSQPLSDPQMIFQIWVNESSSPIRALYLTYLTVINDPE